MSHEGFNASRRHVRSPAEVLYLLALAIFLAVGIFLIALAASRTAHAAEVGDQWDMTTPPRQLSQLPVTPTGRAWFPDFGAVGGRPSQCPARAWCGCYLADKYGLNDKALWNARRWLKVGRRASPGCIGCIAILTRGKRGGHVGIVQGYEGSNPIILSGNHNNAVGVGVYSRSRVLAYRNL